MNNTYLSTEQIKDLAQHCDRVLNSNVKSKIKELSEKYNMTFTNDRQENMNQVWRFAKDVLAKDKVNRVRTGETLAEAVRKSEVFGGNGYISEYIQAYIEKNCKQDYEFVRNFKPAELQSIISDYFRIAGLPITIKFSELLEVSNYEKYFKNNYGIENCSKESIKATDNFCKWVDSVTTGIKNKEAFLWALAEYLKNEDKNTVHIILHR